MSQNNQQLLEYLAEHDAPCPACYRNLRGCMAAVCPACAKALEINEVIWIHGAFQEQNRMPRPMVGSPEATNLERFLDVYEAGCPNCGYPLRKLKDNSCPECGRPLYVSELVEPPTSSGNDVHVQVVTILSVVVASFAALIEFLELLASPGATAGSLFLGLNAALSVALACFLYLYAQRLMIQDLRWVLLFNPVVVAGVLYMVYELLSRLIK
ncbi:MAG: zinc ribbon domain-containing protein [Phycisphaera sp.]|nr:MAG: zinc ribbon domain-containing protein [Phycisphaera sp.]